MGGEERRCDLVPYYIYNHNQREEICSRYQKSKSLAVTAQERLRITLVWSYYYYYYVTIYDLTFCLPVAGGSIVINYQINWLSI